jgi:DNA-binding transcriptional MerR regulator
VTSRTYLSIGDVLTLLREEFPDVTISKIRFLESQGLVNPERSPSGYRKFFDHDVERLRWVLRQQREHFLPLKVIRDRLNGGELDDVLDDDPLDAANGKPSEPAHAGTSSAPGRAGTSASSAAAARSAAETHSTKADEEVMARILADASRRAALMPDVSNERRGLQVVEEEIAATTTGRVSDAATAWAAAGGAAQSGRHAAPSSGSGGDGDPAGAPPRGTGDERDSTGGVHTDPAPTSQPASGGGGTSSATTGVVTGVSLITDELLAASGLSAEELASLEAFGLIEHGIVAGLSTYDEDALTVANLAAAFRAFGIEPRHLRLYRNAVVREVGLIEQVIIPLLRQRNPESRQRALESAEELAALGQSMRATLLHQELRHHLGG